MISILGGVFAVAIICLTAVIVVLIKKLPETDMEIVAKVTHTILKSYEDGFEQHALQSGRLQESMVVDEPSPLQAEADAFAEHNRTNVVNVGTDE